MATKETHITLGDVFERELPCELNPQDAEQKTARLVEALEELRDDEAAFKLAAKSHRDDKKALEVEIEKLVAALGSGEERRDVEVQWRYDWDREIKNLVRLDTEDVIDTVPIPEQERQTMLAGFRPEIEERGEEEGAAVPPGDEDAA